MVNQCVVMAMVDVDTLIPIGMDGGVFCEYGLTPAEIANVVGQRAFVHFIEWMHDRPVAVCRDVMCGNHGEVYYRHAVRRWLESESKK